MDLNTPQLTTAADLEMRAARVADPGTDLKTKLHTRPSPYDPILLEILRSGEVSFQKDSLEHQFRHGLLEILHRIPLTEVIRSQILPLFHGMLYVLRNDNEENAAICCKTIVELARTFRALNEELLAEFAAIVQQLLHNVPSLVIDTLSEDSLPLNSNVMLPATRSFKVLSEVGFVMVTFLQTNRALVSPVVQATLPMIIDVITLQSSVQKKAREDYEAMGDFWSGMATTMENSQAYTDFITAQIKLLSSLAFLTRAWGADCPKTAISARRYSDSISNCHLMGTSHRRALLPHVDKLYHERVLLGTGIGSHESLRSHAFSCVADLLHHLRGDLTSSQLTQICLVYLRHLHNPCYSNHLHVLYPQGAVRILSVLLDSSVDKIESLANVQAEMMGKVDKSQKAASQYDDFVVIETSKTIMAASYATEKPEDAINDYRTLYRTLLHGFRHILIGMKKCDAPVPDGAIISRLFEGCLRCLPLVEGETRDANDALDWLASVLCETNLHVFQEVWTQKMTFYFEASEKRPILMHIVNSLYGREAVSPTLMAIVLRFLIDRLPQLGEYDDQTAAVAIRMFKMTFNAVTLFPQTNEPILASHLGKLIMDCFPLAANASKPSNYFFLLRSLFRSIGGGGGRYELLYKEVLPLLPEMLECLNRQLQSSAENRDLIVELCLTVPLRLTHLLPYLTYLMQPLALALRGTSELVSQGLRTLELCIDNLTPDFLDPTLNTVLRELMEALHNHLRPLPANHHHAHTTIRILGKLGGRNRKLLEKEPALRYRIYADPLKARVSIGGQAESIELTPISQVAHRSLSSVKANAPYRVHAYNYLESCLALLLSEGVKGRDREEIFTRCLEGMYDATHLPEVQGKAEKTLLEVSRFVFSTEIRRLSAKDDPSIRRFPSPLFSCYLDSLSYCLAREDTEEAEMGKELVAAFLRDLVGMTSGPDVSSQDIVAPLHQLASRFSSLCLDNSAVRRSAGCSGIKIMTSIPSLGVKWVHDREQELLRTLLHVLKDMPYDLPREVEEVTDVLFRVVRASDMDSLNNGDNDVTRREKHTNLVSIFFSELSNASAIVRKAAQRCIDLVAELSGQPAYDLLVPHRERMLTSIYTKPLRALPFPLQVGMIEAVRYCISLQPPLPDLNDELMRLLHEALALADADDAALLGRSNQRQGSIEIIKLRVACIKLLTASMPLTDFFSKQHQTRQRVTSVYFKSLYSPTPEVKEVAHEGLRMVLTHQSRLPKELLQTGLRPILMNLADPKRLSIPGLEGLARLLELLTNYFKVEIGHKLLDHFRIVADPQMLQASSRMPLMENEGITKLVCLANIFHLLPSAANIFLENLVNAIYLDRYPGEAVDFFMKHLPFPMHIRTLRSILRGSLAPNLLRELVSRTSNLITECFGAKDSNLILPGLLLCSDLADVVPRWLTEHTCVIDAILILWNTEPSPKESSNISLGELNQRCSLVFSLLKKAVQESPRIDILFEMVTVFARQLPVDFIGASQFFYRHVALSDSLAFRRNVLTRFLIWFEDRSYSWQHKTFFIQYIVTPTILIHATRSASKSGLLDDDIVHKMHRLIWQPMIDDTAFSDADDVFRIELLHLSTVMVQQYPELLQDVKKEIIKCAWYHITSDDPMVKYTAYLLAARFFDAFDGPQKFLLRVWTGLLKPPHTEGKTLINQALDILLPVLTRSQSSEPGYPQWAKTTRRLLAEDSIGFSQINLIYRLIFRQPSLFYPVRALFIPHIVNHLTRLGLSPTATTELRILSIDILQVVFDWEQNTTSLGVEAKAITQSPWITPLAFRESKGHCDSPRSVSAASHCSTIGWSDVTVKLHYFSRALEQNDLNDEGARTQALGAAKVLHIVSAEKNDAWYRANVGVLTQLVRKGIFSEDYGLQDSLHPVVDCLLRLYPLPKEDDDQQTEVSDFHAFIYTTIGENLRNADSLRATSAPILRGTLLTLKSVVQVVPERIEPFGATLMKLLSKLSKDHVHSSPSTAGFEVVVRLLTAILEISHIAVAHLGEQRRLLLHSLVALVEKSKSGGLCRYMLDIARDWAMNKRDPYPTLKEKASLLQKMVAFEMRGERGEALFNSYLELIYDIYTDASLRRSDLTTRLEHPFLLGCRATDPSIRERFVDLLDMSIPRSLSGRLIYILGVQSWEALADQNWMFLALHLLLGSVDADLNLSPTRKGSLEIHAVHDTWVSVFAAAWPGLSRREQVDVTHHMIALLSKEYLIKQAELRPNVIQTLLAGIHACSPPMTLPPHLVKYLAKTFGAWHIAAEILESSLRHVREDEILVRDTVYDSLAEIYAELAEDDIFYGLWRRRALFPETNAGISFEQCGMWDQASNIYEHAQSKTRAGLLPFSEAEFCLWEDHWMLSAEKLQNWETLYDLANSEGNNELLLESAWRIKDWAEPSTREDLEQRINTLSEVVTPRRRVFEASLPYSSYLPSSLSISGPYSIVATLPAVLELQEAVQIFGSLSTTNAQNLEKKSSDLKMVLQAWRERLPNICDDISIWSDLVAWRQNVFGAINKAYIPLITNASQGGAGAGSTNTFGYRGYHETAWIINRFAHVARKHELLDVCFNSLNKIYTLPNIEISEAFLKLREQARCHYQKPGDLQAGLEVINNTNLMYFSPSQKADLRLGLHGANLTIDVQGSSERYVVCRKCCQLLSPSGRTVQEQKESSASHRVLWLLSVDDGTYSITRAFDTYKGDAAFWYWITLIPQLCLSMSQREFKQARYILLNLAKLYPQALFFTLRTTREDMSAMKRAAIAASQRVSNVNGSQSPAIPDSSAAMTKPRGASDDSMIQASQMNATTDAGQNVPRTSENARQTAPAEPRNAADVTIAYLTRQYDQVEEVVQILKTAFPLLILSMETVVEQIQHRFKATPDEEIYRLTCMLLQDATQQYVTRLPNDDDGQLSPQTLSNLTRLAMNLSGVNRVCIILWSRHKLILTSIVEQKQYEDEFLKKKLTLYDYIRRLQSWRDRYERYLDARPRVGSLYLLSHYLVEFQFAKFDEVEVPGQYTEASPLISIGCCGFESLVRSLTIVDRMDTLGGASRCMEMTVPYIALRYNFRQAAIAVVKKGTLHRRKESRKRNLHFHLPAAISLAPNLRLLQNDPSYVTLGDIYDQYCEEGGNAREDPMLVVGEKARESFVYQSEDVLQPTRAEYYTLRTDMMDEVLQTVSPEDILTRYMIRTMDGPCELWRMRKEFASQIAASSFMTYAICLSSRLPSRFHLSRTTGQIAMSEILPGLAPQAPVFFSNDTVPFRLTPNMQHFLGPVLTEGLLAPGIMTIGRCLTEPDYELEQYLCLFARDEVITWLHQHHRGKMPTPIDSSFRKQVATCIEGVVKRAETMACKVEREQAGQSTQNPTTTPATQTVTNLIGLATNPVNLMRMSDLFLPWF
ncbi:Transcription-associated protein 1 [Grifola frondosa]|uniref:Transcription-associated protein 1 n=1 Tax=Grifola frondosa TaxID=5627 RepID=A0A1C7M5T0_GRIFR|nr:Transcription-associated protein 1 [Grifola frondosa]